MGVLTVLNPGLKVYLYFIIIPFRSGFFTAGYAFISVFFLAGAGGGLGGGIAHMAHLVGLVIGLAYGQPVPQAKSERQRPEPPRVRAVAALVDQAARAVLAAPDAVGSDRIADGLSQTP